MICYEYDGASMAKTHTAPSKPHLTKPTEHIEKLRRGLVTHGPRHRAASNAEARAAAVLVPIIERKGELHLVYIRRSDLVESHRGQVAFPGGRVDPEDRTLLDTALREAREEVNIEPHTVDVLGGFPTMSTVSTGMLVAPFVGVLTSAPAYRADPVEVAEIFEVPLSVLADARYRGRYEWKRDGGRASSHFPAIFYSGQTIWGLTLRITESLLEILGIPRP